MAADSDTSFPSLLRLLYQLITVPQILIPSGLTFDSCSEDTQQNTRSKRVPNLAAEMDAVKVALHLPPIILSST